MALTTEQLQTLAIYVQNTPSLLATLTAGSDNVVTAALNAPSTFYAYRTYVQSGEVGAAVNYIAVEAMTDANRGRITTFYTMNPQGFDPRRADIRSYWDNTFSGALGGQGQATRDALNALWRRLLNNAERQFATGTGTTIAPGAGRPMSMRSPGMYSDHRVQRRVLI